MNVLKQNLRVTIATLLAHGASQHEIARRTGVDRKTVRRYAATSNSPMATGSASAAEQIPPPWPPASADADLRAPAQASSACAPHRAWIETQVALGRNAVAIYQDLVEQHGLPTRRVSNVPWNSRCSIAKLTCRLSSDEELIEDSTRVWV